MADEIDEILHRLVAGELSQAEASELISQLDQGTHAKRATDEVSADAEVVDAEIVDDAPQSPDLIGQLGTFAADFASVASRQLQRLFAGDPKRSAERADMHHSQPQQPGIERVRIRAVGCRVEIMADPSVATLVADGPHQLRHAGNAIEVIAEGRGSQFANGINPLGLLRSANDGSLLSGPSLLLRVNPGIVVDAEVTGGGLISRGMSHLGVIRVHFAGVQLKDVEQIDEGAVNAGTATITGRFSQGRSRISVSGGNANIRLTDSANVTIRSLNSLGRISWPNPDLQSLSEYVVGDGAGKLDLDVVVGRAKIVQLPAGAA